MNIKRLGQYTMITGIPYKDGEIRQLYKGNKMIQLFINDQYIKRTVSDVHQMKTLYESIKDKATNIVKVIFDSRGHK